MMKSLATVTLPNGLVLGVTTLTDLQDYLKVALLVITIVYTLWCFRRDFRRDRNRDYVRDRQSDADNDRQ